VVVNDGIIFNSKAFKKMKAFISPFNTQTIHIKSFYTQQHCYVSLKNLTPWRDSKPGLLVPEADAISTAPRHQGWPSKICHGSEFWYENTPHLATPVRGGEEGGELLFTTVVPRLKMSLMSSSFRHR
jgi:hypothetical protein